MDFAQFWYGPSEGETPGFSIENSLRFRGTSALHRDIGGNTISANYTVSFWMKLADPNNRGSLFSFGNDWGTSSTGPTIDYDPSHDGCLTIYAVNASSAVRSTALYRDPGAWYHIMYVNEDGVGTKVFVNGQESINTSTVTVAPGNSTMAIGNIANVSATSLRFEGYMAAWYFIDGQALTVADFGEYDANGVWVPTAYTGTYGTNGFHLDFSDPDDIGADRSGNGNHFTPTGFDFAPVGVFSDDLFTSASAADPDLNSTLKGFELPGGAPAHAFDGTAGNAAASAGAREWIIWRPASPIRVNTSLRLQLMNSTSDVWVNGTSTGITTSTVASLIYTDISGALTFPFDLETIAVRGATSLQATLARVELDGATLVDNTGTDYDLMLDSPTQNYATLNPLVPSSNRTLANANLQLTMSTDSTGVPATLSVTSGKWYYEVYLQEINSGSNTYIGVVRNLNGASPATADAIYYRTNFGSIVKFQTETQSGLTAANAGDFVGVEFNLDAGEITWYVNGTQVGSTESFSGNADGVWSIFLSNENTGVNKQLDLNFGQKNFVYTQTSGFNAWQTQNLPDAPIPNGRDHFQVITGPGQGNDGATAGQLGGNWSGQLFSAPPNGNTYGDLTTDFRSVNPATQAFNGVVGGNKDNNAAAPSNAGDYCVFQPDTPINVTTSLRVYTRNYGGSATYSVNSADAVSMPNIGDNSSSTFDWADLNFTGQLTSFGIKDGGSRANLFAIEIDGDMLVDFGILARAQNTFPNGLWWIKDRANSNEHQLVDSVRGGNLALTCPQVQGQIAYNPPSGDSVAWCWSAPEGWSNPAGTDGATIASSGQRNIEAGFSIIEYTGTASLPQTFAHGLDEAPEFMIFRAYDSAQNTVVAGPGILPVTESLLLNWNGAKFATAGTFNNTAPTDKLITVGDSTTVLTNDGGGYVCYAWHSVPGYSAFGSYEGNGDSGGDGPYVYTGFSTAFLLIKRVNLGANWCVLDSTRDTSNPAGNTLFPNSTLTESALANQVDFTSNGFKLRGSGGTAFNEVGSTYVYAAFAENPFGGSNVSPATAR